MIAVLYGLLGLATGALTLWLTRRRGHSERNGRAAMHAALLGLLLPTLGLLLMALAPADNSHTVTQMQQMLGQAARHMSLPLLGLAALQLAREQFWQPMAWGRLVIGLMLCFEVARRLDWQEGWLWLISLAGLAAFGAAALLRIRDKRIAGCWLLSSLGLLLPMIGGAAPMAAMLEPSLTASALLPLFAGAALAVGLLANPAHNDATLTESTKQRAARQ